MDRMTDRETNTLAARGLEELFFQLCCCVSFWFWQEIVLKMQTRNYKKNLLGYFIEVEGIGAFGQPTLHSMISLKTDTGPFKGAFFSVDADII
jgi:hypothetical protein